MATIGGKTVLVIDIFGGVSSAGLPPRRADTKAEQVLGILAQLV
jgi:hypothetical protein